MGAAAIIILAIGAPLILMAIGLIILVTKVFGGDSVRAERAQTLEAARQLERTLSALETRLSSLEDIILSADARKKGAD